MCSASSAILSFSQLRASHQQQLCSSKASHLLPLWPPQWHPRRMLGGRATSKSWTWWRTTLSVSWWVSPRDALLSTFGLVRIRDWERIDWLVVLISRGVTPVARVGMLPLPSRFFPKRRSNHRRSAAFTWTLAALTGVSRDSAGLTLLATKRTLSTVLKFVYVCPLFDCLRYSFQCFFFFSQHGNALRCVFTSM